ncbi:MAG: glycosyltransferase family 9 protein [Chloroflexi bacterium]|nr:glycosyltransferase family 9 protein [Chloroflexota bacterium]
MADPNQISFLARVQRRLRYDWQSKFLPRWWHLNLHLRKPTIRRVLGFGGGLGDQLLCTAIFRALREHGEADLWMQTNNPELFAHNPDIAGIIPVMPYYFKIIEQHGLPFKRLNYTTHIKEQARDLPPQQHLITNMASVLGIDYPVGVRPYLHLTEAERTQHIISKPYIAVQSSILAARYPIATKEWYPERMQVVVNQLAKRFTIVQLGMPSDPKLEHVIDLRGKASIRESAAILQAAQLFIGFVGFQMHLARAVDCRSVIIFGGREAPFQSGYSCNSNLYTPLSCAPCWLWENCPIERQCMQEITPEMVLAAVEEQLDLVGQPLKIDYITPRPAHELIELEIHCA